MKRLILVTGLFMFVSYSLFAQTKPYNVVFDLTSKDTSDQKSLIRWLKSISESNSSAKMEVVLYGQSLDMVTKDKSAVEDDVKELVTNKNVQFKVCEAAMKRHNLDKSLLISAVQTVPNGIQEIVTKQGEGWGYIKVAH